MKKAQFTFNPYPYRFISHYREKVWNNTLEELPHKGYEEESRLDATELDSLLSARNAMNTLPLINYTTQYGLGCFEGLKAYPQKNGGFALFRAEQNALRFKRSMTMLKMPPFPEHMFIEAIHDILKKSFAKGYGPQYQTKWEQDNFLTAQTVYIRPFTYSETGFGVNLSVNPSVIIVASNVGSFFNIIDCPSVLVSNRIRATKNGTGSIKCAANYVISSIDKSEAISKGHIESLFLDAQDRKYIEECSSCNVFFVLQDDTVVTPPLSDTILPGITRDSTIQLLKDSGHTVEERQISIEEVFDSAKECFYTGTAVGISHFGKLTYHDKDLYFGNGKIGEITQATQTLLKRIQYGVCDDPYGWRIPIE